MGKGKPIQSKRKPEADKIGCNCPIGCELNVPMTIPPCGGAILMICSNDKCAINQNFHKQCYDNLEAVLIRTIQSSMGRTRDWTDDQCRRFMWSRVYDMIYRNCKCVCGGHLKKHEDAEVAAVVAKLGDAADAGEVCKKKKNKAGRKDLPKLIQQEKTKVVGQPASSSTVSKALPNAHQAPAAPYASSYVSKNVSEMDRFQQQAYIPGLVLMTDEKPKNKKNHPKPQIPPSPIDIDDDVGAAVAHDVQQRNGVETDQNKRSSISIDSSTVADYAKISFDNAFIYSDIELALNELVAKFTAPASVENKKAVAGNEINFDSINNHFDSRFFPKKFDKMFDGHVRPPNYV